MINHNAFFRIIKDLGKTSALNTLILLCIFSLSVSPSFVQANDATSFNPVPIVVKATGGVPVGTIAIWGTAEPIPDGWAICDGENGTPNLGTKFIRGATVTTVGTIGGSTSEDGNVGWTNLTKEQMPEHDHLLGNPAMAGVHAAPAAMFVIPVWHNYSWGHVGKPPVRTRQAGDGDAHTHEMPAYYNALYIIKIE